MSQLSPFAPPTNHVTQLYPNDAACAAHAAIMNQYGWYAAHAQRNPDGSHWVTWHPVVARVEPEKGFAVYRSGGHMQTLSQQPMPSPQPAARPSQTIVREYRSVNEFERDMCKLAPQGWTVVSQSAGVTRTAVAKNIRNTVLTLGINRITPGIGGVARKTTIVVTYQR
jgi:hypothetical protein